MPQSESDSHDPHKIGERLLDVVAVDAVEAENVVNRVVVVEYVVDAEKVVAAVVVVVSSGVELGEHWL